MLQALRSASRSQHVKPITPRGLAGRLSINASPHVHRQCVCHISTPQTRSRQAEQRTRTSESNSDSISVFLPQEQTQLKPLVNTATSSTTSQISDHHDLPSFLRYHNARRASTTDPEKRVKLSRSYVFLGTRYEYLIQRHLQDHLGFDLTRVGGAGDGGVDLIGTWKLPLPETGGDGVAKSGNGTTFRVILQAKRIATSRKLQPGLMRELEGTLTYANSMRSLQEAFAAHRIRRLNSSGRLETPVDSAEPVEHEKADLSHLSTIGILIATRPLTDGIEKAMASSRRPLMYMYLEDSSLLDPKEETTTHNHQTWDEQGPVSQGTSDLSVPNTKIRQITWNNAASRVGLEGYNVLRRYHDDGDAAQDGHGLQGEAAMTYLGNPVHFQKQVP
ncbi:hypothetical protein LTR51_005615 [Lithohypha guttulata]|nr:hypothetical protein LTR51_005615 [Lithohypha guttulata]